jgi:hypothetical protein
MTILKYEIADPPSVITGRVSVDMDATARPFSVAIVDDETIVVWALVSDDPAVNPLTVPRTLRVANTGQSMPDVSTTARFLGTVVTRHGIVWHIWDEDA